MTEIDGKIYKITSPSRRVYIGQTTLPKEERAQMRKEYDALHPNN